MSKTLPNYDWVCTYACIFSNKLRRKSPRIVFLRHYSRPPLQTHTSESSWQLSFFVASLLQAHCYHQVNDRSARSGVSHPASGCMRCWCVAVHQHSHKLGSVWPFICVCCEMELLCYDVLVGAWVRWKQNCSMASSSSWASRVGVVLWRRRWRLKSLWVTATNETQLFHAVVHAGGKKVFIRSKTLEIATNETPLFHAVVHAISRGDWLWWMTSGTLHLTQASVSQVLNLIR